MSKELSHSQKITCFEIIRKRDGGIHCLYCKTLLTDKTLIFEHLNDERSDNRVDNLAFACQSCNIKKYYDEHLDFLAGAKLESNEKRFYVREKILEKLEDTEIECKSASKEIEINEKNYDIAKKYLYDQLFNRVDILFTNTLHSIVYLCKENTGHGSHPSVRNYLATLTSSESPFEIIRNTKNKKIIVKRVLSK